MAAMRGRPGSPRVLLTKPFGLTELAAKVRDVLDGLPRS